VWRVTFRGTARRGRGEILSEFHRNLQNPKNFWGSFLRDWRDEKRGKRVKEQAKWEGGNCEWQYPPLRQKSEDGQDTTYYTVTCRGRKNGEPIQKDDRASGRWAQSASAYKERFWGVGFGGVWGWGVGGVYARARSVEEGRSHHPLQEGLKIISLPRVNGQRVWNVRKNAGT